MPSKKNASDIPAIPKGCEFLVDDPRPLLTLCRCAGYFPHDVAVIMGTTVQETGEPNQKVARQFLAGWRCISDAAALRLRKHLISAGATEAQITFAFLQQRKIYLQKGFASKQRDRTPAVRI